MLFSCYLNLTLCVTKLYLKSFLIALLYIRTSFHYDLISNFIDIILRYNIDLVSDFIEIILRCNIIRFTLAGHRLIYAVSVVKFLFLFVDVKTCIINCCTIFCSVLFDYSIESRYHNNNISNCLVLTIMMLFEFSSERHISCLRLILTNCKYVEVLYSFVMQFIKDKFMSLGLLNKGSLGTKHDELVVAMSRYPVDIMAINETWLREGEEARAPVLPGYRLRHAPRQYGSAVGGRQRGGGVGFYIKRGVSARLLAHPETPGVDQMWLRLNVNGLKLAIGTAYRPPWQNVEMFLDALTDTVTSLSTFDHIVLSGDFNVDLLESDSDTKKLLDFLNCFGLEQYVNVPTHFTDHSATLIDLLCSNLKLVDVVVDLIPDLSSHSFLSCKLRVKKQKPPLEWMVYRPLKDIDLEKFICDLDNINWNSFITPDVDEMVEIFRSHVLNLFDKHAPVKKVLIKNKSYPWITFNVKEMMKTRDKAHARSRLSNVEAHRVYYKDLKSIVNEALHSEKKAFFNSNVNLNLKNPRVLWKNIKRNVANFKSNSVDLPSHLQDPNIINNHFLSLPSSNVTSISDLTYFEFHSHGPSVFSILPISDYEVSKIIKSFSTNATGIDSMSMDMILLTLPQTLTLITAIVNTSIISNKFPTQWKTAIVKPLPKTNNPTNLKDLRPISILTFLSKIVEKAVCTQLTKFLEVNNILPKKQSGFRRCYSTTTALLDVVDDILAAQDTGEGTILTLLDFSRAFDTIDTSLLLSKLSYYGFDSASVGWFASYLNGRSQLVEIRKTDGSSHVSNTLPVTRGVPQGSILGPILFSLYCTDIIHKIKNCKYHLYADDLQLYISFIPCNVNTAVNKLNQDLDGLVDWCGSNGLVLNPVKTKYLVLGSKNQICKILLGNPKVQVKGISIDRVTEARNLGLSMDGAITFESYVLQTVRNCFFRLSVLYRVREYLNTDLRITLCDSLILSKLNYVDNVFGGCLLVRSKKLIQRVQNACIRFCFPIPQRAHISPYINKHGFLNMSSRRNFHFATLLFGIIKSHRPSYLYEKLDFSARNIRCAIRLICPRHRTTAFRGSFRYAATKCWNNIPPPIRNSNTIFSFKKSLKEYLLNLQKSVL